MELDVFKPLADYLIICEFGQIQLQNVVVLRIGLLD
jgi:hypothetical protein